MQCPPGERRAVTILFIHSSCSNSGDIAMLHSKITSGTLIAALIAIPFTLFAPADGWAAREQMIITTRKTEENLQDVPISVSAITDIEIEQKGISTIQGVAKYTPGVEFDEGYGGQDNRIVIRGLSPTRGRANAAFLVDGIDFTGEAMTTAGSAFSVNQRLIDVERIEVVKGPQSALFGRSAFAGAVQYITKNPNLENWEGDISVDIGSAAVSDGKGGEEETQQFTASIGGPLTDNFGLRLNGVIYDDGGFYDNSITGAEVGGADGVGAALTALWEVSETLSIKARGAFSNDEFQPRAQARVPSNTVVNLPANLIYTSGAGGPFFPRSNYPDCGPWPPGSSDNALTSCLGTPKVIVTGKLPDGDELSVTRSPDPATGGEYPGTDLDVMTLTLFIDWETGIGTFTSYTGMSKSDSDQLFDGNWDSMPAGSYTSLDGTWTINLPPCGLPNCSPIGQQIDFENDTDLFSQEIRYATNLDGPVNFTAGALYWNEEVDQTERGMTVSPAYFRGFPPGPPSYLSWPTAASVIIDAGPGLNPRFKSREVEHWSIYGLIDWDINDTLKLTLEGRYVDEDLTNVGSVCLVAETAALTGLVNADPTVCSGSFRGGSSLAQASGGTLPDGTWTNAVTGPLEAKYNDSFFTPKATLEWRPSDTRMWYASIAQGKKPGGISTIAGGTFFDPDNNTFDSEELMAYELGAKMLFADGAVTVNGAAFFQDYTDKQVGVTQFDTRIQSDVSSIENAGEAEIWGVELDAAWEINEHWYVAASYTWLDAEYTKFESITGSSSEVARTLQAGHGGCLELIDLDPDPAAISNACRVSRTGNRIEDIPESAFVGYARWNTAVGGNGMNMFIDANVIFNGSRYIEENNLKELDAYWLTDIRLGVTSDNWEVVLFVDNLFDDDTVKSAVDVGSQIETFKQGSFPPGPNDGVLASLPDPRVAGIRARFGFGGGQ